MKIGKGFIVFETRDEEMCFKYGVIKQAADSINRERAQRRRLLDILKSIREERQRIEQVLKRDTEVYELLTGRKF